MHHQVLHDRTYDHFSQRPLRPPRCPKVLSQETIGCVLHALDVPLAVAADFLQDFRDWLVLTGGHGLYVPCVHIEVTARAA